jgi:hypothetical protein
LQNTQVLYSDSFENHVDWVNDIALADDGQLRTVSTPRMPREFPNASSHS